MTTIAKDSVVTFHYRLMDEQGAEIETSTGREPNAVLIGHQNLLPALEEAIMGKVSGDVISVTLPPEKGYGVRRADAKQRIPLKYVQTKGRLKPGQVILVNSEHGGRNVTVVKVGLHNVDVDTNHPLAGKTIQFEVSVVDVRAASAEELSHGHAHGAGGHHH